MLKAYDNENLYKEVSKEDLLKVLHYFQKYRSLGPEGWTIEFFMDFFNLLGEDPLWVIEDVMCVERFLRTSIQPLLN